MARLNEPSTATETIETLRRKFIRQNRDFARVNSTQSLRIRSLENECARILSENLDLRGQVLRLETELTESKSQRIADHALEIRDKMETQLVEWGAMLASLGHEPPAKKRSPRRYAKSRARPSMGHSSPPQWRRRDTREVEASAVQDGRLPPLWENKPYVRERETLNREEIMALCADAESTAESPDLGPPPVSRFVDADPIKFDLPSRLSTEPSASTNAEGSPVRVPKPPRQLPPSPSPAKEKADEGDVVDAMDKECGELNPPHLPHLHSPSKPAEADQIPTESKLESQSSFSTVKAGLKRKSRDGEEKENAAPSRPAPGASAPPKTLRDKPLRDDSLSARDRPSNRPIKGVPSRMDSRSKSVSTTASSVTHRQPLAAKSSNGIVGTPQKPTKSSAVEPAIVAGAEGKRQERTKAKRKGAVTTAGPKSAPSSDVPVATIEIEAEPLGAEPSTATLHSPVLSAPPEEMRETPPPIDISDKGETTRGSRRARTAVSYAEPNLRDKMRRPTKQLFDAVTGEGKSESVRRTSQSKGNDSSAPPSAVKAEPTVPVLEVTMAESSEQPEATASPFVPKAAPASPSHHLPTSVVTDRKKRAPAMQAQEGESDGAVAPAIKTARSTSRRLEDIAAREIEVADMFVQSEPVHPVASAPDDGPKRVAGAATKTSTTSRQSRSRRLSSMASSLAREDLAPASGRSTRASDHRKRASMTVPKKSKMEAGAMAQDRPADADNSLNSISSAEGDGSARENSSVRRRSMML